jgi:hypothetical protein
VVRGSTPAFRCSRCKYTFEIQPPRDSGPQSSGPIQATEQSAELAFKFEAVNPTAPAPDSFSPEAESPFQPTPTTATASANAAGAAPRNSPPPTAVTAEPPSSTRSEEPSSITPPPRDGGDKVLNIAPYREQRASVMPFFTLLGLLVMIAAFVFAYQKTDPEAAESWLAGIPLVGPSVVRNEHLKNGVLLKSVETKFQILQGNREALVLTGVAVNQNPKMIRNVQLSGQLFDHEGKEIERQTMWIGNAISLQIIRGMSAQDVADLQRLKPLKTFEIPPGDSVPFAIVFLRPSKSLKDARCEVVSVEAV